MQAGRKRAKIHKQRVEQLSELEERMRNAQRDSNKSVRLKRKRRLY